MVENGANIETAPTLSVFIPFLTIIGILFLRQNHGLDDHFGLTSGGGAEWLMMLSQYLSVQLLLALLTGLRFFSSMASFSKCLSANAGSAMNMSNDARIKDKCFTFLSHFKSGFAASDNGFSSFATQNYAPFGCGAQGACLVSVNSEVDSSVRRVADRTEFLHERSQSCAVVMVGIDAPCAAGNRAGIDYRFGSWLILVDSASAVSLVFFSTGPTILPDL